ncbi:MAG: M20 family metallopeptidase [Acidimicrobiales bacterium]|jgi:amidohydrolase|nr:M20 family metallopeptidase [Acidimicrobiales bacterium]
MDVADAKREVVEEVDRLAELLVDASHQIHAHPELGFEEHFAHDLLADLLEGQGLPVERHAYGLDTAFSADAGTQGPLIAVCCEYDALPALGHACGHNIIAAAGLGAGLAAARLAQDCGGRVRILGTPAEEGGGGKVFLIRAGALDGVDAAMMVHPAGSDLRTFGAIAIQQLWVTYHGTAAHAAAAPHRGRNALDAAVLGYVNVAALRQHIAPDERIHGIFTEAGDKPNIVPARAASQWYVRSGDLRTLEALKARVLACLQAGADAAGCEMTFEWRDPAYADLVDVDPFIDLYVANAATLGRTVLDPAEATAVVGSTDMGNVSYEVPSIHPMIAVSPPEVPIHSEAFAVHAAAAPGDRAVLDGAKAMAMTVVDLWLQPGALEGVRRAFEVVRPS